MNSDWKLDDTFERPVSPSPLVSISSPKPNIVLVAGKPVNVTQKIKEKLRGTAIVDRYRERPKRLSSVWDSQKTQKDKNNLMSEWASETQ